MAAPIVAQPPLFSAATADGALPPAPIEKISADWSIGLGSAKPRELSGMHWAALRRQGAALPPFPSSGCVVLTSGDRIPIDSKLPFQIDEERLSLPTEFGRISMPRAYLAYYCRRVPDGADDASRFLDGVAKGKRNRDVIYLTNGDRVEGALAAPAQGPVYVMNVGARQVATPLDRIAVLAANSGLQARPQTKKAFAHVITSSGSRLQCSSLMLDAKKQSLSGRTLFGARVEIPLGRVALVAMRQGVATYLSDLTPKSFTTTPFLGVTWPLALDTDVAGRQILLGGNYHDKGLGMHAAGRVTYSLGGKYNWFEAVVGVVPAPGRPGQAKVSVWLDGKASLANKELTGDSEPLPVRVDVRAGQELTLQVDFGERGDVRGRVSWADAWLVKKP